jgi:predicted phage terminase large subunit-like protein
MLSFAQFNKADVLASIVKESFFEFVKEFWDVVCAETPIWNWHIQYLCDLLQDMAFKVQRKEPLGYDYLIINISPGSTKSLLLSIMFPAWVWTWWPSASFVGCSHDDQLATRMSRLNRAIVKSDLYSIAFPKTKIIIDQDSKGDFANVSKGERMAVGINGNITGRHADFVFIDDALNPKGARSEAELISTNNTITESLRNRKKDKINTPTILLMQRLHDNDPTGMLLKRFKDNIKLICIPAELTDAVNPPELKKYYIDGLMDPVRLPRNFLQKEKIVGDFYYAGQYLQNPVPLGGGMFKTERINIEESLPKEWTKQVRFWDKGGTKDGGCYTVGTKLGFNCDGKVWIIDVKRGQWDAAERERIIKQTAMIDGKDVIIGVEQEGGSGGKESAENTARNLMGYKVRLDRPTGDKAARADPFATQVNAHNVNMLKAEWNDAYINELAYFPDSTYKDQVDSSSGAFKLLNQKEMIVGVW